MLMRRGKGQPAQRGMSLVELMVGIAVGLFVVAGATALVGGQLGDTRRLTLETQMQQDLRAAADIMSRDLRRAGHWADAHNSVLLITGGTAERNIYTAITPTASADSTTTYSYMRGPGQSGPYGYRLTSGVIQSQLASSGWQDLTDTRVMEVTSFTVTPRNIESSVLPCPKICSDGTTACWPKVMVRELDIAIEAKSRADASVTRRISSSVRLRNDWVRFTDGSNPNDMCPA